MEIGKGKQERGAETKTLVVVATECNGKQIGRVRFKCIPDAFPVRTIALRNFCNHVHTVSYDFTERDKQFVSNRLPFLP